MPIDNEKSSFLKNTYDVKEEDARYNPRPKREVRGTSNKSFNFKSSSTQGQDGVVKEKIAPKRNICSMGYDPDRFMKIKAAEYGGDLVGDG